MFDDIGSVAALVGAILGAYAAILWLGIIVWTYRDIRARTHDTWSQAVAVLLVALFNIPGLFLYLILRPHETLAESYERRLETEMIRQEFAEHRRSCPSCQLPVREDFLLCPNCRTTLREPCLVCNRPLSLEWVACPYCGSQGPRGTREARVASVKAAMTAQQPAAPVAAEATAQPSVRQAPVVDQAPVRPPEPAPAQAAPTPQRAAPHNPAPVSPPTSATQATRGRRAGDRQRSQPSSSAPSGPSSQPPPSPQPGPTP